MGGVVSADLSVIIPCYCASATIERAVASVIGQIMPPRFIFLVEDNSPDDGATRVALDSLVRRFQGSRGITLRVLHNPTNDGPGNARNRAWDLVETRYIAFLDADDVWHPRKVEVQYEWMCAHPEYSLTGHSDRILRLEEADMPEIRYDGQCREIERVPLLISNRLFTRTVMLDAQLPHRFANKWFSEDYLLWLEIVFDGRRACVLECPLAYSFKRAFGEGGLTSRLWDMERGELDTFLRLSKSQRISRLTMYFVMVLSIFKYVLRLLRTMTHRLLGRTDASNPMVSR